MVAFAVAFVAVVVVAFAFAFVAVVGVASVVAVGE